MNTTKTPDRFAALPDEDTLAATVTALEEHGFSVEVVDDLDAAREAVLARIPHGSSVMTNTSVTLQEAGIADAVNDSGHYDSARARMAGLDFATQLQEMKVIGGQPDYALGSVHAITRDGVLVIASASGSQLASYAWGAANVIFVVGAQKLVPTLEAARDRIYSHSLVLEDGRAVAAYGQHSYVGKILDPRGTPRPRPHRPGPPARRRVLTSRVLAGEDAVQAGPDRGVAFLFGRSAPYAVHLPGVYREVEALTADQAARAHRLGLGYLGLVAASGRHWEEQVGVSGPARR